MNITLNIEAGNPLELHEVITGLAGILVVTVAPQPEPEKVKKSGKATTKPEKEKQPDPEPAADPEVVDETTPEETPDSVTKEAVEDTTPETEEIPTIVELRAAAQKKGGTPEGKKAIKALLDEIGSKNLTEIPEEKRAAFIQKLGEIK